MAIMGLRINNPGGLDTSIGDTLMKAVFGDPEAAIRAARLKSDLEAQQYQNRQMEAAAAYSQAQADREQWELNQRATNLPTFQDYYGGLVEAPQPAIVEGALPAPVLDLPDPIPVEIGQVTDQSVRRGADGNATVLPGSRPVLADTDPIPVEWPFKEGPELRADEDTIQLPQPDELPGEVIPVTPEQQAAYERDVAAKRAQAALIIGGGGNAAQMAQGLGIGEGIVKSGSSDPDVRRQGNVLYTGSNPPDTPPTAPGASPYLKQELDMRKQLEGLDAYKKLSAIVPVYGSMLKSAGGPIDHAAVMDLVYGLATAEDPGSVVREADSLAVKRIGGLSGEMQDIVSYFTGGKPVTPDVVAKIMRTAGNRYKSYKQAWDWQAKSAADIATRSGFDVRNAIPTFEELGDFKPPPPVSPAEAAAVDDKYPG